MRLFSRPPHKLPPSAPPPLPAAGATVTRRIEITVEREWSQAVFLAQDDASPVAPVDTAQDVEGAPDRAPGRLR